jgi:hypothetical protein
VERTLLLVGARWQSGGSDTAAGTGTGSIIDERICE